MPGLLDLPPELIEHIHFAHERLIEAEHENGVGVAEEVGRSRLTCRYFEHATRCGYVEKNFVVWMVKAPNDENIERFCAMASTPGLATAIRKLHLSFDDDYTMEVAKTDHFPECLGTDDVVTSSPDLKFQLEKRHSSETREEIPSILPEVRVTHAYDNITEALVPSAYLRHRVELIEAFRACKNVTELYIGNRALEHELMHRYKRSSRRNVNGAPFPPEPEGDEQDTDGSEDGDDVENASVDASEDGEESASDEEDSEGSGGGEREDEDHDGEDSDINDRSQGNAAEVEEQYNNPDESTEHRNEHIADHRDILYDITPSLNHALHLAAEAGMRPKTIDLFDRCTRSIAARVRSGLTDCTGLLRSKATLEWLTALGLSFVQHQQVSQGVHFEEM